MSIIRRKSGSNIQHPMKTAGFILLAVFCFIAMARWTPIASVLNHIQAQIYQGSSSLNTFIVQLFQSSESAKGQLHDCQNLAADYLVDSAYVDQLESRINDLEYLLDYKQSVDYKTIAARILSRSPSDAFTLLIDQGSNDGIKPGLAAVVNEGHLVGIVDTVSDHTSTVRLLEDEQTRIPVQIMGESQTNGLLVGEGGFLLKMEYIPQDRIIEPGQLIVTSQLYEKIPNNLVIGTVYEVHKEETSAFQEALIEPIYQSTTYANVLIIDTTSVRIYEE